MMPNELTIAVSSASLPLTQGEFSISVFSEQKNGLEHVVLESRKTDRKRPVLLRLHSSCMTGDIFGSLRCDCGKQLEAALNQIAEEGGVLLYLQQEGRGIGLSNKVKAYALQEAGMDTVEANHKLGFADDLRDYRVAAEILKKLGIDQFRLLTNNPKKMQGLRDAGIDIISREPIVMPSQAYNRQYLKTKRDKLGHLLPEDKNAD